MFNLLDFIRDTYNHNPLLFLFVSGVSLSGFIFLISVLLTSGQVLSDSLFRDAADSFMDHFNMVYYAYEGAYDVHHNMYPPLIVSIYYMISVVTVPPDVIFECMKPSMMLRNSNTSIAILIVLIVTFSTALYKAVEVTTNVMDGRLKKIVPLCIVTSYPIIYSIERGNCIMFALLFVMFFTILYECSNKKVRFFSYICLAIAAGIKPYVAIFGLLLLKKRDYRGVGITILTTLIIYIVPLVALGYNLDVLMQIFLSGVNYSENKIVMPSFGNINSIVLFLNGYLSDETIKILSRVLLFCLYALVIVVVLKAHNMEKWKVYAFMALGCALGLGSGAAYNLIFITIPLLSFLVNEKEVTVINCLYLLVFISIFAWMVPFTFGDLRFDNIRRAPMWILLLLLIADLLVQKINDYRFSHSVENEVP